MRLHTGLRPVAVPAFIVSIQPVQLGITFVHLEPVRNVRVKLLRMLHSVIEDFDRLRRLETGLEIHVN